MWDNFKSPPLLPRQDNSFLTKVINQGTGDDNIAVVIWQTDYIYAPAYRSLACPKPTGATSWLGTG